MHKWSEQYGQYIVGILFTVYFFSTLYNLAYLEVEIFFAVLLTIVLYMQSVGSFFYSYKKRKRPYLIDWMKVSLFIMITLNFMAIINNKEKEGLLVGIINTTISFSDAYLTMIIMSFSFLSLDAGRILSQAYKKRKRKRYYILIRKKGVFSILILSTVIQLYLYINNFKGFYGGADNSAGLLSLINSVANLLNPFALITSAYVIFLENNKVKIFSVVFYFLLVTQVLLGVLSGMKENALLPIFYVGIVYVFSGKKIPRNIVYIGVFLVAILYPINNSYRNVITDSSLSTESRVLNMAIAVREVYEKPFVDTLFSGIESYGDRGNMYPFVQYSINTEPEWNYYKYMQRYIFIPIAWFLPRAIWGDKPRADNGSVLYENIVGVRTSTAVTPLNIGWAYLEGGVVFLIVIFFCLGISFTYFDCSHLNKPIDLLMYITLLHFALKPEWDPYFFFISIIQSYITFSILIRIIGIRER